jgi:hypothetical protein
MGFTSITANVNSDPTSGTSIAVTLTGVNAGDFVFVPVAIAGTPTISVSDGTSSLTALGQVLMGDSSDQLQGFYILASVASGSVTYTATFSGSVAYRIIEAWAFRPTGAVTFDAGTAQEVTGTSSGDSGNITTAGYDVLALGYSKANDGGSASAQAINGLSCTDNGTFLGAAMWWKTFTAPFTGSASFINTGATRILTGIAAFKILSTGSLSSIVGSSSIIRVPGPRRTMIIPG